MQEAGQRERAEQQAAELVMKKIGSKRTLRPKRVLILLGSSFKNPQGARQQPPLRKFPQIFAAVLQRSRGRHERNDPPLLRASARASCSLR
jgi:hypothetical protein